MVGFQSGVFNIGAEGQFLAGALVATAIGVGFEPFFGQAVVALLGGALAGALWASMAAALRIRRGVHEVITTILLNFIALYLVSWAVEGPLQEASGNYPQSDRLAPTALLWRLPLDSRPRRRGPGVRDRCDRRSRDVADSPRVAAPSFGSESGRSALRRLPRHRGISQSPSRSRARSRASRARWRSPGSRVASSSASPGLRLHRDRDRAPGRASRRRRGRSGALLRRARRPVPARWSASAGVSSVMVLAVQGATLLAIALRCNDKHAGWRAALPERTVGSRPMAA